MHTMHTKVSFVPPDEEEYPGMIYIIIGSTGYWSFGDDLDEAIGNYPGQVSDFRNGRETLSVYLCHKSTSVTPEGKWTRESGTLAPILIAIIGGINDKGEDVLDGLGELVDYYNEDEDEDDDDLLSVKEYVAQ